MADGTSGTAPYLRVAAALRARVADGTWSAGFRLPSRSVLGAEFAVGENVIRRAQELLIAQGLLEGRPGSGTYVRAVRPQRRMLRGWRAGDGGAFPEMAVLGSAGTWEADSTAKVPAPPEIAARLAVPDGERCVCTVYEFFADRQPVMLATSWEPMTLTGGTAVLLPEGGPLAGHGVVARMASIGITVVRAVEVPRQVQVDREQAQLLGVSVGSSATLIERTLFEQGGSPAETADILVPAEHWEIVYELGRQSGTDSS
ncbi:GntR family transcriptional regulator [Streptomyces sp. 846.5]|nr:GntR family transcriptional regulator [Streptomyces sp. 846.5]TDT93325.1 GntR family transcriptional regulator [Streptomyces sp. 846.5]